MNKLYSFVVTSSGHINLVKLTSEVFNVYRSVGTGAVPNYEHVGTLKSDSPSLYLTEAGDYFVASAEDGYMCPSNVHGFFLYAESRESCLTPFPPQYPYPACYTFPGNISLKVFPDGTDAMGNPAYMLAIAQSGQPVGQGIRLKAILDTESNVIVYAIPTN